MNHVRGEAVGDMSQPREESWLPSGCKVDRGRSEGSSASGNRCLENDFFPSPSTLFHGDSLPVVCQEPESQFVGGEDCSIDDECPGDGRPQPPPEYAVALLADALAEAIGNAAVLRRREVLLGLRLRLEP